ncbi:MAG: DUF2730 family protein, partial [Sphingomonadales bacterium]|nr:DUF2730 family protein [Sphingomonadales bacterium]
LTKIDERAVKLRVEVTEIKSDLKHLPTEQALSALTVQLSNLHGDMKALSERMNGVASIQEMMKDHARIMDEFLRKMP